MKRETISLDDKYTVTGGRAFLTGTQALVRLPMLQKMRDQAAGLDTAGFVSGYRGSPLGNLDLQLWKAREQLQSQRIVFQPGINEDLAATAIWGTQQVGLFPGAKHRGVFAMWYGKGPGVDRCGDVFRHANAAGTSPFGGVLAIAGDDHAAKSSTLPHQTEHIFKAVMMPVLAPANTQEYLDFGLHGWAMSRYSGCWVAFKALADTVETSASVFVDPFAVDIRIPTDFALPEGGLNIRWPDPPLVQEARLLHHKLYAALAYCRANGLNKTIIDSPTPRLGIITCGKSYLDVRQAFDELGIDEALAAEIGIRLYKVGMVWPLESEGVRHFAEGLEEILVVEEKRQLLEYQLKEELYNWREDVRPRVIGKFDEKGEWAMIPQTGADGKIVVDHGEWLLPAAGELSVARIAAVIAGRIQRFFTSDSIEQRLALIAGKQKALAQPLTLATRTPFFCSGCPHNTSTRVPEGSRAVAGIGCHYMVTWMDRRTETFTHMGGEGVPWVGQAPFTETKHIFANLGDGTYFHSGLLAIRQSIAAGVNITYKILYNDAVAMTGGQPVDGVLTVPRITRQLEAEGAAKIVIVSDEPEKYHGVQDLAPDTAIHHRDELDVVQRQLRELPGCTILIYDQTCATEKRRRRKRGTLVDPARRVYIHPLVCEGCGDCSEQSNCLSIVPLETEFGRKRAIDQSSCNKDFSCLKGFCPSFVTIEGGQLRKRNPRLSAEADESRFAPPPEPALPATDTPWSILVTGVGGTGVVTIGALVGMAAHLDGKGVSVLDMTGLAQKFGAVFSHLRIADRPDDLHAVRIATGEADAIVGGDLVVTAGAEAQSRMLAGRTRAVVNCCETPTAEFTRNPDWTMPTHKLQRQVADALGHTDATPCAWFVDAQTLATALMGDAVFTNLFLLGFAWQKGMVPVSSGSLMRAVDMNGVAAEANKKAFLWGRRAAVDLAAVQAFAAPAGAFEAAGPHTLDELIARRVDVLTAYQDAAYARRYVAFIERVRTAEAVFASTAVSEAVARNYFKLLAFKDEYEVARLYADPAFRQAIDARFEGDFKLHFHFAPPLWSRPDPETGRIGKRMFGPWMQVALGLLARLKGWRGSRLDPFARTAERKMALELIAEYEADIRWMLHYLAEDRPDAVDKLPAAARLAAWPQLVRGFGHVRAASIERMRNEKLALKHAVSSPLR